MQLLDPEDGTTLREIQAPSTHITARGGGNSTEIGWDYNLKLDYESSGKANVELKNWAKWDVLD